MFTKVTFMFSTKMLLIGFLTHPQLTIKSNPLSVKMNEICMRSKLEINESITKPNRTIYTPNVQVVPANISAVVVWKYIHGIESYKRKYEKKNVIFQGCFNFSIVGMYGKKSRPSFNVTFLIEQGMFMPNVTDLFSSKRL